MALAQRLEIRQGQALVMTPQLQQAIKLLQLSNMELQSYVEDELERNPLLEREESDESGGSIAADAPEPAASLFESAKEEMNGRRDHMQSMLEAHITSTKYQDLKGAYCAPLKPLCRLSRMAAQNRKVLLW